MKDRIAHIMRAKNLKASDFAELLGIQPSGISHILSGRNQPSLDFIKKVKETFPEYNLDWIIFGKGPMTTSEPFRENPGPTIVFPEADAPKADDTASSAPFAPVPDALFPTDSPIVSDQNSGKPTVRSLYILYTDGTFESFSPR